MVADWSGWALAVFINTLTSTTALRARMTIDAYTFEENRHIPRGLEPEQERADAMAGLLTRAEARFRRALGCNPSYVNAHNGLGAIDIKRKDYSSAKEHFDVAREVAPSDPLAYANFADAALLNGEMDISETMYLLAIDVAGNDAAFYDWWGNTLLYNSREGAEEKFAEAARLDADNPEILLNWAEALSLRTDHDKAIELLKRAEGLDTDSPRLHALWGASLYAKKEQPAAEDRFRKALAAAAENGGDVLAEWRRVLVANDLFEDALAAYPMDGRDPEAIYALWKAAYREKTTDGAAILCDKLSLFGLDFFETLSGLDAAYFSEQISDLVDHCFADRSEP